ncbi:hypothetical protein HDU86_005515 [Geranomyces michiganensis]|nr:hypothetical protein HDU86_005515 [Geranomyces michiganensis]
MLLRTVLSLLTLAGAVQAAIRPLWHSVPTDITRVTACSVSDPIPSKDTVWIVGGFRVDESGTIIPHGLTKFSPSTGDAVDVPGLPIRWGAACAAHGDLLLIYGGTTTERFLNDTLIFNMKSETWAPVPTSVETWDWQDGELAFATSQVVGKWWIITGGISDWDEYWSYFDALPLYALDLDEWTWYAPPPTNAFNKIYTKDNLEITIDDPAALARADGATSCVVDGKMLVYIGFQCYDVPSRYCDYRPAQQFLIDPITNPKRWSITSVPIAGAPPYASYLASAHATNAGSKGVLYTFGGQYVNVNNAVFVTNQAFMLDIDTMTWSEILVENAAAMILPRASSLGMLYNDNLFFVGGHGWDGGQQDAWQLLPKAGADVNRALLAGDLLEHPGVAGTHTQLSFTLHNADNSPVTYGGAHVTGTLIAESGSSGIALAATDLLNGTYTIPIEQFSSGEFFLEIYLNGDLYRGQGIPITFRPSDPELANSTVLAGGSAEGLWEESGAFALTLLDTYGNVITSAAKEGLIGLETSFESDGKPLIAASMDGALYLTYEGRKAGPDSVNVKLNGQHIAGSPFQINVIVATQISYSDPAIAAVTAFNALGCVLALLTCSWVIKERHTRALRHASPAILGILAITHAAMFLGNIFGPTFSSVSCYVRECTLFYGASVIIGLLLGKTGRLYVLFIGRPMRKMTIKDRDIINLAGILGALEALVLAIKNVLVSWNLQRSAMGTRNEAWSCQTTPRYSSFTSAPTIMYILLGFWAAGLGTALAYLAWVTRNCLKKSNESRIIVALSSIVVATVIAYGVVKGTAKDLSVVKLYYMEVWLVCFDIYVSLIAIVAVRLKSVRMLYTSVWNGTSSALRSTTTSGGGATEEEEVTLSILPDDKRGAMMLSSTERHGPPAPASVSGISKALRWRDEAKQRGSLAHPCSFRVVAGVWRLAPWFAQWDVGLLLTNGTAGMCVLAPGVFSKTLAVKAIELREIGDITWKGCTAKIETSTVIAHVRLSSLDQLEALKIYLQPLKAPQTRADS